MKRITQALRPPYRGGDYRLLSAGRGGTYWQGADGRNVRLAASESEPPIERSRMSMFGMLIAIVASGTAAR